MRCWLACLAFFTLTGLNPPPPALIHYILEPELTEGSITALVVRVQFAAASSGLTKFGWRARWGGEDHLWQWAQDFKVSSATSATKISGGEWEIASRPHAHLEVSYRVVSAYEDDPTVEDFDQPKPIVRPEWFYAVGNTVFGFPKGRDKYPVSFRWQTNSRDIKFASDLEHLAIQSRTGTIDDLEDSILIGGRELRLFPPEDGSGVRLAIIGSYTFSPEHLDRLTRRVISAEREFWRADAAEAYLVSIAPLKGTPDLMSFSGTGRGDGFAIWVDERTPLESLIWLLAHEYFHTWNPGRLGHIPSNIASDPSDFWFSEGFTDYYARALMVRAGVITPEQFIEQWNEVLSDYAASTVRNLPQHLVAEQFWEDGSVQKLPYQRGAMLAALWNAQMTTQSGGKQNLDDVVRDQLLAARNSSENPVRLFRSVAQLRGLHTSEDEKRYLERGETIELPPGTFGECAVVVSEPRPGAAGFKQRIVLRKRAESCRKTLGGLPVARKN